MNINSILLSVLLGAHSSVFAASSIFDIAPSGWENRDGNSAYLIPFSPEVSSRFQQVYSPLALGGDSRAYLISGINFRTDDPFGNGFSRTLPDIQINFSTTPRAVNDLSATFADNVGLNDTVMVPRGPLLLRGDYFQDQSVQSLTTYIGFTQPFFWNPQDGNLLLDVRNYLGVRTSVFDAVDLPNDDVAAVYGLVGDTRGTLTSAGLVTGLHVTLMPIPEPSTFALLMVGLIAFGFSARSRRDHDR